MLRVEVNPELIRWACERSGLEDDALAERFPKLRLDTDRLEYQPSVQFRSLKSLPVAWS